MNVSIGERWEKSADLAGPPGLLGRARAALRADIRSFPFRATSLSSGIWATTRRSRWSISWKTVSTSRRISKETFEE